MNLDAISESTNDVENSSVFRALPWKAKVAARLLRNRMPAWTVWVFLAVSLFNALVCLDQPSWMHFFASLMFFAFAATEMVNQGMRYLFSLSSAEIDALKIKLDRPDTAPISPPNSVDPIL